MTEKIEQENQYQIFMKKMLLGIDIESINHEMNKLENDIGCCTHANTHTTTIPTNKSFSLGSLSSKLNPSCHSTLH